MQFLAGSRPWLRHLDVVNGQLKTIEEKLKNVGKSLRADVLKDKVERHVRGENKLGLEPGQVAAYLDGSRVERVRALLGEMHRARSCPVQNACFGPADPPDKRKMCRGCNTLAVRRHPEGRVHRWS